MAGESVITITGNLTKDPALRFLASGQAVASFTIASTPRYLDKATGEWKDGETWFVPCSAWRELGQNICETLQRGASVVATGRLQARSYEVTGDDGQTTRRTVVELTVDDLGPSLKRATAKVVKTIRERPTAPPDQDQWASNPPPQQAPAQQPTAPYQPPPGFGDSAAAASGGFSDDPPF